jgi:hypothetical protein
MQSEIKDHLDRLIQDSSREHEVRYLIDAKKKYFDLTGAVNEDDDDFEARMNLFNEWFLFNYRPDDRESPIVYEYVDREKIAPSIAEALTKVNYSIFEYTRNTWGGKVLLNDYIHDRSFTLEQSPSDVGVVKKDLFIGRVVCYQNTYFLLSGVCLLPEEIKSILKKESKKIRKFKSTAKEIEFLLKVEALKTKWKRYSHVDATKIFIFDN